MTDFINKSGLTYEGKEAQEIFVKNLYTSNVHNLGVRMLPGVKGKQKLNSGEVGDMFQAYSCPFSPKGNVKISESFIEPIKIKVNLEECFDGFKDTWMVESTEASLNGNIPTPFYDWFFGKALTPELNKEYEEIWFNGDTEYMEDTKEYLKLGDGIVKKLDKTPGTVKVTGSKLTVANILGEIAKVAEKVDNLENDVEDYRIYINYKDYRKVLTALGQASADGVKTIDVWSNFVKDGDGVAAYGMKLMPCRIAESVMIASHPQNLVLGYDIENSEIQYKIVDMRETTLDDTFRVGVISNIAAGVVFPETTVLYKQA